MASTDATPLPIKNQAYRVTFGIFDADGDLVTGAAGLDSEVSKDGGTFTDCTSEATEIATASGMYFLDLTATEMNADTVAILVKTSTVGAKTTALVLYPAESTDILVNVTAISGDTVAADNAESFFDGTGYAGTNNVIPTVTTTGTAANVTTVNGLAANVITATAIASNAITSAKVATDAIGAAQLAADAVTEIQSGLASASALTTVGSNVSSVLANTDVATSTRLAASSYVSPPSAASISSAVWSEATRTLTGFGTLVSDIWSAGTRLLTAGTNIVLAKGVGVTGFNDVSAAQVNAEVLDVLAVDTFAEPSSVPAATSTFKDMVHWLFTLARNKRTTTATVDTLRNDADSGTIATAAVADDTVTFTRSKYS